MPTQDQPKTYTYTAVPGIALSPEGEGIIVGDSSTSEYAVVLLVAG